MSPGPSLTRSSTSVPITDRTSNEPTMANYTFTSESVTEGHPDKMADQISDAVSWTRSSPRIPTAGSPARPWSPPACASFAGEISTNAYVEIPEDRPRDHQQHRLRQRPPTASTATPVACSSRSIEQSPDIAQGVDAERRGPRRHLGRGCAQPARCAGDQGMMFGYACNETDTLDPEALMPLPIWVAHRLVRATRRGPQVRPEAVLAPRRQDAGDLSSTRRSAGRTDRVC